MSCSMPLNSNLPEVEVTGETTRTWSNHGENDNQIVVHSAGIGNAYVQLIDNGIRITFNVVQRANCCVALAH